MRIIGALAAATWTSLLVAMLLGIHPATASSRGTGPVAEVRIRLTRWLHASETLVGPESFMGMVAGMAALAGLLGGLTGVPALAVLAAGSGAIVPIMTVQRRRASCSRLRAGAWPDAVRDLTTELRSGSSLHRALVGLGESGPLPLRPAFVRYQALTTALDHRAALETVRSELADPRSDRIIEVLLIAFDQGTRVVIDVLEDLARSVVDDVHLLADIETARLEVTLEARGAAVLPFVVLAILCSGSSGYRGFYASTAGTVVVLVGLMLTLVGLGLIARLGRIPDEPRVLIEGS